MKAPAPIERRLFTYEQAATYLSISVRQMKKYAAEDQILKVNIGNAVRFDRADLDALVDRLKKAAS